MPSPSPAPEHQVTQPRSIAYPLDEFYARSGLALPPLDQVEGAALPEPYKTLLAHDRDMTSTLELFHGAGIHLRLISRAATDHDYFREVLLEVDGTNQSVEFGAIQIHLDRFPAKARAEILEERFPLGHVLRVHSIAYVSRPKAFLRIASDKLINRLLHLQGAHVLYGRRNTLFNPTNEPLAEIVEILPPVPK